MSMKGASRARETEEGRFIFTTADTCNFFGISREALSSWGKKGAPKEGRGKWDLKKVMEWRFSGGHVESPETRKLKAEADLKELKAAQEQIKLGITKAEFIPANVVRAELTRTLANMKKSLMAIGHNAALALATLSPEAAETAKNEVDKMVSDALTELSEGGLYRNGSKKKAKK